MPGSAKDVAQSGIGLAVRSGAPKPDISTVEAFKQTILAAKSIAFSRLGASGVHFAEVIERLGIADEIRRKAVISDAYMGEVVARGEAELAVQQISELMPVAGIDIVGPLPGELQKISLFAAAIFTAAKNPAGGAKLVSFLAEPGLAPILARKGLSPAVNVFSLLLKGGGRGGGRGQQEPRVSRPPPRPSPFQGEGARS